MAAVIGDYHIIFIQVGEYTHCVGLLPEAGVGRAGEDPALKFIDQKVLKAADLIKLPEETQIMIHGMPPLWPQNARESSARVPGPN